jgi:hypothetical protein
VASTGLRFLGRDPADAARLMDRPPLMAVDPEEHKMRQVARVLTVGTLMALSAAAGFYFNHLAHDPSEPELELNFPDYNPQLVNPVTPGQEYGCDATTEAEAAENRIHTNGAGLAPTANARSGTATDKVALRIAEDGKGVYALFAFDVAHGATDAGDPIPIIEQTSDYLVASRRDNLGVTSLILDVKTLKAVVSFTGQGMLGTKGRSLLLQCH